MSNVIKAGTLPVQALFGPAAEKPAGVVIDSNRKAELYFSGLAKNRTAETEEEEDPVISPEAEAAMKEQAALILSDAMNEAKSIREQALREAGIQKNSILEEARNQGYQEGYDSGLAALREKENELLQQAAQNRREYEALVDELEPQFSDLVIRYVQKLTGILMEESRPVVGHLMKEAIRNSEPGKNYLIHVSPQEYGEVKGMEQELSDLVSSRAEVEILSDKALGPGQCKIETDSCVIDTGLGTRFQALAENLRLLTEGR